MSAGAAARPGRGGDLPLGGNELRRIMSMFEEPEGGGNPVVFADPRDDADPDTLLASCGAIERGLETLRKPGLSWKLSPFLARCRRNGASILVVRDDRSGGGWLRMRFMPDRWVPAKPPAGVRPLLLDVGGKLSLEDVTCRGIPEARGHLSLAVCAFGSGSLRLSSGSTKGWRRGVPGAWPYGGSASLGTDTGKRWLAWLARQAHAAGAVILHDGCHGATELDGWEVARRLEERLAPRVPVFRLPEPDLIPFTDEEYDAMIGAWRDTWDGAMRSLRDRPGARRR